jgi:PE-PPE domain/PE family
VAAEQWNVLAEPPAMLAAAADVTGIGSAINDAKAAAAGPTTGVLEAAADEVSAAAAALFNSYAREYQALIKGAGAFHDEFARLLAAAGNAYAETETGTSNALTAPPARGEPTPVGISLIMTPTDIPIPSPRYLSEVYSLYISPNFTTTNIHGLTTPEQLFPITGLRSMTLDQSVRQGLTILNNAIFKAYDSGITPINVFGYSQSAVIASLEMQKLIAAGVPSTDVNFVLVGDPMNPNGGMFTRFPGLGLPHLGGMYSGGTPSNAYPTVIYTGEYDGFADFPRYPIDVFADLNAVMGVLYVHNLYPTFTEAQLASSVELPTSGPTMTTYYMIPTENLPLLEPLRAIPIIGNPLADLLQPDLTYLVNWGYGDPAYGYSTGPANVNTPFGFLPPHSATVALQHDLVIGTQQGIAAAGADLHAEGFPTLPRL